MSRQTDRNRKTSLVPDYARGRQRRHGSAPSFDILERRTMLDAGAIQFSSAPFSVADSAGTVPIVMTRTGGSSGAVSVKLTTSDGTAVAGTDYDALSGSVSFPDGATTEKVNLSVLPDPVANLSGHTVNLTLSNPAGGATLGSPASAVLTITHVATPGDLDGSFGTNGRVILLPGPPNLNVWASPGPPVLIASDGSSYGVSLFYMTTPYIDVNKFMPDGTPDTSYGTDGLASVSVPGLSNLTGTAFQPDGKILVDGDYDTSSGYYFVLARFNTDGTPDTTFGQNGVVTLAIPTQFVGVAGEITVLSGGQIVVSDAYGSFANAGLALLAFGADGSPSLTFGSGGIATTTLGPNSSGRPSVLAMRDGTCVVSGYVGSGGSQQPALWRFNADGSLDTAFGSGGIALGPVGYFGGTVVLAPDGDIVQLGVGGFGVGGTVAFYRNDGTLDASVGSGGESDFGTMAPVALAFQPSGQIVVIGATVNAAGGQGPSVLARLNADGSVDTGFGQGGFAYDDGSETPESPNALACLPDGNILEGATTTDTEDGISGILFELDRYVAPTSIITPTITWSNPSDIIYGTALDATQLDASASVPGTFSYSPAIGTILRAGINQPLSVTFTPTDTNDYHVTTDSVMINVDKATPTINWANPADITYGSALSGSQLNASSSWTVGGVTGSVAGTFTYTPDTGTVLTAGKGQSLLVSFAPTDTTDYTTAAATRIIDVDKATPTITWPNPAGISYGTALSGSQLDALSSWAVSGVTGSVAGTFTYMPDAGTVLHAGNDQVLSVSFTPSDTTNYANASGTANINVSQATPTITLVTAAEVVTGIVVGSPELHAVASVPGSITYNPPAGTILYAGEQTLAVTFTPTDTTDYFGGTTIDSIDVLQATPTLTWANPAAITPGTPLGLAQLDATSPVAGTFTYTPAQGTVLNAGPDQTLSVMFTPTDTTDYTSATASVTINVQRIPTITWGNPANLVFGTALTALQLDATASVPGTFTYSPAAGTVLGAGANQPLTVTFTPNDTTDYATTHSTTLINVARATPTITWTNPAAIIAGTALGAAQLDAIASVPGVFTYTPAAGTVLTAGANRPLMVTFTPTDTTDYAVATGSTTINVMAVHTPPYVTEIVSVSQTRKGLTAITIGFDEGMDSGSVGNRALYSVLGAVKKHKKTVYTKGVGIKGITFDGNTHVTIKFAKPYKGAAKLTVLGDILAADGASSDVDFSAVVD